MDGTLPPQHPASMAPLASTALYSSTTPIECNRQQPRIHLSDICCQWIPSPPKQLAAHAAASASRSYRIAMFMYVFLIGFWTWGSPRHQRHLGWPPPMSPGADSVINVCQP